MAREAAVAPVDGLLEEGILAGPRPGAPADPEVEVARDAAPGLLGLIACRRRARPAEDPHTAYRALLGRELSEEDRAAFAGMAWWSDAVTRGGGRVLVLAPRGTDDAEDPIDMWGLLSYVLSLADERVVREGQTYSVVWVQRGDHRVSAWSAWQFRKSLHQRYLQNVDEV